MTTHTRMAALAAAGITLAFAPPAFAERVWDLHAIAEVTSGYSDNIQSSPDEPPPDVPPRDDAGFTTVAPGLWLVVDSPKATQELLWTVEGTLVAGASVGESLATRGEWTAMFRPARTVVVRSAAQLALGYFTASLLPTVGGEDVVSFPGGGQSVSFSAEDALTWEFVHNWRLHQMASASGYSQLSPLPEGGGIDAGGGGGLERVWENTAVGSNGLVSYTDFSETGVTGAQSQMTWRAIGFVRQDLGERTSLYADGGAVGLIAAVGAAEHTARAVGDLVVSRIVGEDGAIQLSGGRLIRPNLYLGHTVQRDQVLATARLPLPWGRDRLTRRAPVAVSLAGGAANSRAIDVQTGDLSDPWQVYRGTGAVTYSPRQDLRVGVRYEYVQQVGDPMLGPVFLPFSRHLVMLSFWGRFPREPEARGRAEWRRRMERVDETFDEPDQPVDNAGRSE